MNRSNPWALLSETSYSVIKKFDIDAVKWDRQLEKTYYDTDLKASEAVVNLHENYSDRKSVV